MKKRCLCLDVLKYCKEGNYTDYPVNLSNYYIQRPRESGTYFRHVLKDIINNRPDIDILWIDLSRVLVGASWFESAFGYLSAEERYILSKKLYVTATNYHIYKGCIERYMQLELEQHKDVICKKKSKSIFSLKKVKMYFTRLLKST